MAGILFAVVVSTIVFVALAAAAADGLRHGDHSGESLARALQKDLDAAAAEWDRYHPSTGNDT